jgi:hypothetical protein
MAKRRESVVLGSFEVVSCTQDLDLRTTWEYEGNYQEYEKDRHRRLGADADQPHRIKYRRIDA